MHISVCMLSFSEELIKNIAERTPVTPLVPYPASILLSFFDRILFGFKGEPSWAYTIQERSVRRLGK